MGNDISLFATIAKLLEFSPAVQVPLLGYLTWLVYRIYNNHLPHIIEEIREGDKHIDRRIDLLYRESLEYRHEFNKRIAVLEGQTKAKDDER